MKKLISILFSLSVFATPAFAGTTLIFSKDGQKATISMTAMANNPDATRLFDALTQMPKDFSGRLSKVVKFKDESGVPTLDINCLVSNAVKEVGNCVVTFYRSASVDFQPARNAVMVVVHGGDAARLASEFRISSPNVYNSDDGKFKITAHSDVLELTYQ